MAPDPVKLQAEGWHISPQAVKEVAEELECTEDECYKTLINLDLKRVGLPGLPPDCNSATCSSIPGPVVLQVQAIKDVSRSSTSLSSGSARLLMLKLTDGKVNAKAAEHKRIDALNDMLSPGTKVQIKGATVRMGVIMLEPKCLKVLGGRVDALAEAHEFAQRYANVERSKGGDNDMDQAPVFKTFIPGRDNMKGIPGGASKAAAQQAAVPPAQAPGASANASQSGLSLTQQTLAAATYALPGKGAHNGGAGQADKDGHKEEEVSRRAPVDVAPVVFSVGAGPGQAKAGAKLQELLASKEAEAGGRGGRGGGRKAGRGGRGRRGRNDADDDGVGDGALTLEEYEAQKKAKLNSMLGGGSSKPSGAPPAGPSLAEQEAADQAMARALQAQLDMEEQVSAAQRQVQQQSSGGGRGPGQGQGRGGSGRERPASGRGRGGGFGGGGKGEAGGMLDGNMDGKDRGRAADSRDHRDAGQGGGSGRGSGQGRGRGRMGDGGGGGAAAVPPQEPPPRWWHQQQPQQPAQPHLQQGPHQARPASAQPCAPPPPQPSAPTQRPQSARPAPLYTPAAPVQQQHPQQSRPAQQSRPTAPGPSVPPLPRPVHTSHQQVPQAQQQVPQAQQQAQTTRPGSGRPGRGGRMGSPANGGGRGALPAGGPELQGGHTPRGPQLAPFPQAAPPAMPQQPHAPPPPSMQSMAYGPGHQRMAQAAVAAALGGGGARRGARMSGGASRGGPPGQQQP